MLESREDAWGDWASSDAFIRKRTRRRAKLFFYLLVI